jgi:hypothetical protein
MMEKRGGLGRPEYWVPAASQLLHSASILDLIYAILTISTLSILEILLSWLTSLYNPGEEKY